jgi:hypothetical protein
MNNPLITDESTPSKGAMTIAPTAKIRTTQATLISVIVAGFVCGGMLNSISNKLDNQARDMSTMRGDVNELMHAVFYNDPRVTGPSGYQNPKTQPKASAVP